MRKDFLPFSKPSISEEDISAVADVLQGAGHLHQGDVVFIHTQIQQRAAACVGQGIGDVGQLVGGDGLVIFGQGQTRG